MLQAEDGAAKRSSIEKRSSTHTKSSADNLWTYPKFWSEDLQPALLDQHNPSSQSVSKSSTLKKSQSEVSLAGKLSGNVLDKNIQLCMYGLIVILELISYSTSICTDAP